MKKRLLHLSLVALSCLGLFAGASLTASADRSNGGGNNGGAGGGAGYWTFARGTDNTDEALNSAMNHVSNLKGHRNDINYAYFWARNWGKVDISNNQWAVCKLSNVVWWTTGNYSNDNGIWATYIRGTNKWGDSKSAKARGGLPQRTAMINWMNKYGDPTWNSGRVVIACSGNLPQQPTVKTVTHYGNTSSENGFNKTITGIHDSTTNLSPEQTNDYKNYSADKQAQWNATHHSQSNGPVTNAWGKWVDTLTQNSVDKNSASVQSQLDNLKSKSDSLQKGDYIAHPTVNLDNANQKGFANGAVFTVSELRKTVTVQYSGKQSWVQPTKWTCKQKYLGNKKVGGEYGCSTPQANGQKTLKNATISKSDKLVNAPYSYWQMINVRCNQKGNQISGFVDDSHGRGDGASTGHTRTYRYDNDTPFGNRPLGNNSQSNSTLQQTSNDSFFSSATRSSSSSCAYPIDCTSLRQPSAANASRSNVQNKTDKMANGTYGAQSNGTSSDHFSFYRDGEPHQLRTDLWYPITDYSDSNISVDGTQPAMITRVLFDTHGTPTGNIFGIRTSPNGHDFLTGSDIANGNSWQTDSEVTNFYPHATWPSEKDNPQKMGIDWTWQPTITNTVYTKVDGSGNASGKTTSTSKVLATCAIHFNGTGHHSPYVTNDPYNDSNLGQLTSDNYIGDMLGIGFVRSTNDLH